MVSDVDKKTSRTARRGMKKDSPSGAGFLRIRYFRMGFRSSGMLVEESKEKMNTA